MVVSVGEIDRSVSTYVRNRWCRTGVKVTGNHFFGGSGELPLPAWPQDDGGRQSNDSKRGNTDPCCQPEGMVAHDLTSTQETRCNRSSLDNGFQPEFGTHPTWRPATRLLALPHRESLLRRRQCHQMRQFESRDEYACQTIVSDRGLVEQDRDRQWRRLKSRRFSEIWRSRNGRSGPPNRCPE